MPGKRIAARSSSAQRAARASRAVGRAERGEPDLQIGIGDEQVRRAGQGRFDEGLAFVLDEGLLVGDEEPNEITLGLIRHPHDGGCEQLPFAGRADTAHGGDRYAPRHGRRSSNASL